MALGPRTCERRWHTSIGRFVSAVALATLAVATVERADRRSCAADAGVEKNCRRIPDDLAHPLCSFGSYAAAAASIGLINSFGNL